MKQVYLALTERVAAIRDRDGRPIFKHIDRYNSQPEFLDEVTFPFPAVFVEFADVAWRTLGRGNIGLNAEGLPTRVQIGEATVRFHVVQQTYADTHRGAKTQTVGLEVWDALDALSAAIQGFAPPLCTQFDRKRLRSDTRHNVVSVDVVEFFTTVEQRLPVPDRNNDGKLHDFCVEKGVFLPKNAVGG